MPADRSSSAASDSPGAILRAAREARGLSVHKAAQDMHISDAIVEALERDDFSSLGAPIFVRGHLRNYARLLGLPEDELLAAEHSADKLAPPPLITLQPDGARAFGRRFAMPGFSALVIALLLVLGVVWWQRRPAEQSATVLAQHETSSALKTPLPAPNGVTAGGASSGKTETARFETTPGKSELTPQRDNVPPSTKVTAIKQNPPAKPAMPPGAPANKIRILSPTAAGLAASQVTHAQFTLSQPSWIEVYDASGKRLYYDLAPAGDTLDVSGAGPLQVFLGNAPGVSIEMDGNPFNLAPYTHADNTARFRLGNATGNGGQAG